MIVGQRIQRHAVDAVGDSGHKLATTRIAGDDARQGRAIGQRDAIASIPAVDGVGVGDREDGVRDGGQAVFDIITEMGLDVADT